MQKKSLYWLDIFGLFIISLLLFTWGIADQEVIGFESRFYLFALEMWRHGMSFFPSTYHHPYPDYPATAILLMNGFAHLFGQMNKLTAVLPSAIAAALTVVTTYLIGALHERRWGLMACLFLFLTVTFLKSARSISLDMFTTLITALSFYLIYSADSYAKRTHVWLVYPLLFLGFLFRGPIGLIMPAGVISIYYLLNQRYKAFLLSSCLALCLLIFCSGLLLISAYHTGGESFVHDVMRMQVLGRMHDRSLPFYFYFIDSLKKYALTYPLALLVLLGLVSSSKPKGGKRHLVWQLFAWAGVILIGMSIPGDKKIRYILPMAPALALITAYPFTLHETSLYFERFRRFLLTFLFYLPAILMLGVEIVYFYAQAHTIEFNIYYTLIILTLIGLQLVNFWLGYRYIKQAQKQQLFIIAIAALGFVLTYINVIEPIELYTERGRTFISAIESERIKNKATLIFYKEKPDGLPIKYLMNMQQDTQPIFIDHVEALEAWQSPAYFVTTVSAFEQLPDHIKNHYEIIANDVLGHVRVVVFRKKSLKE